ncbi:hypothetical protein EIP91_009259, partial [Steccherinum ochraceum]
MHDLLCADCSPSLSPMLPSVISSMSEHEIDSLLDACKGAIAQYHGIMRSLKTARNVGCAKISRLPDDILEAIFFVLAEGHRGSQACIPPTLVCRRWRSIAIGSPLLWCTVTVDRLTRLDCLASILSLSCGLPLNVKILTVHAHYESEISPVVLTRVLEELPRARRLYLDFDRPYYTFFRDYVPKPSLSLESVK